MHANIYYEKNLPSSLFSLPSYIPVISFLFGNIHFVIQNSYSELPSYLLLNIRYAMKLLRKQQKYKKILSYNNTSYFFYLYVFIILWISQSITKYSGNAKGILHDKEEAFWQAQDTGKINILVICVCLLFLYLYLYFFLHFIYWKMIKRKQ